MDPLSDCIEIGYAGSTTQFNTQIAVVGRSGSECSLVKGINLVTPLNAEEQRSKEDKINEDSRGKGEVRFPARQALDARELNPCDPSWSGNGFQRFRSQRINK
jgi:hypothetical protein